MKPTSYTDADRVRLAEPSLDGRLMLGPDEVEECDEHPGHYRVHRWVWWAKGEGPETADAESLSNCELCEKDDEDDEDDED